DARTGKYEGNSYNVGDSVNLMDYSLKAAHADVFAKTCELIRFRKAQAAFRLASRAEISAKVTDMVQQGGNISFKADGLLVFHSISGMQAELDGTWKVLYSNVRDAGETLSGTFSIGTNESIVLGKAE
ncbi:MAG: hypothetical protein J6Z23_03525, partial [Lachnospiraceae bacterium]|nr:hypothetical protein [Lachnospiraceae bacterium]